MDIYLVKRTSYTNDAGWVMSNTVCYGAYWKFEGAAMRLTSIYNKLKRAIASQKDYCGFDVRIDNREKPAKVVLEECIYEWTEWEIEKVEIHLTYRKGFVKEEECLYGLRHLEL